ncbi:MAG: signal recognition particle receptor subunit alpha [Lachnospiraceae bacterium]|nr:signal recognition particle receptor subunit alpha [Lachnospiraceae bacterium]
MKPSELKANFGKNADGSLAEEAPQEVVEEPVEEGGFFKKLVAGLSKTRDNFVRNMDYAFGATEINDDFYEELEEILISGDIGVRTTDAILEKLKEEVRARKIVDPTECKQVLVDAIRSQMDLGDAAYEFEKQRSVVFVIGVSLWIFLGLLHERLSFGKLVARLAYYAVPLIVVLLVVLVVMLMHQNPAGSAESYLYLGSSAHAWLTPLFLFGALNALLVIYDYKKGVVVLPSQSLFLVVFLVYCLLSLLRIFPLDVRGSMALTVVLTIALVERFFLIIPVHSYIKVFVLFCLMQVCRTTPLSELGSTNIDTKTFLEFTELKQNSSYDKLFVDYWMNPDFRYLYEYGALRNEAQKDGYPNRFVLQIDDDDPSKVVMPGEVDCDYYIITRFSKFTKQYDMSPFRPLDDESQDIYQRN